MESDVVTLLGEVNTVSGDQSLLFNAHCECRCGCGCKGSVVGGACSVGDGSFEVGEKKRGAATVEPTIPRGSGVFDVITSALSPVELELEGNGGNSTQKYSAMG